MATDDWQTIPLGQALTFQRGFDITKSEQRLGPYPVFSSSGAKSTHSNYMVRGPGVITGITFTQFRSVGRHSPSNAVSRASSRPTTT